MAARVTDVFGNDGIATTQVTVKYGVERRAEVDRCVGSALAHLS